AGGFGEEYALYGHLHEVAVILALDDLTCPGRELALNLDAIPVTEFGTEAGGNQIQRVLAQRRALDGVYGALVSAAVFLEPALQKDGEGRFAAGWRPEQQQQASAHIGPRCGSLEVIDHARKGLVDPEQLALEELARVGAVAGFGRQSASVPAQHVPDVLVTRARHGVRVGRQDI